MSGYEQRKNKRKTIPSIRCVVSAKSWAVYIVHEPYTERGSKNGVGAMLLLYILVVYILVLVYSSASSCLQIVRTNRWVCWTNTQHTAEYERTTAARALQMCLHTFIHTQIHTHTTSRSVHFMPMNARELRPQKKERNPCCVALCGVCL